MIAERLGTLASNNNICKNVIADVPVPLRRCYLVLMVAALTGSFLREAAERKKGGKNGSKPSTVQETIPILKKADRTKKYKDEEDEEKVKNELSITTSDFFETKDFIHEREGDKNEENEIEKNEKNEKNEKERPMDPEQIRMVSENFCQKLEELTFLRLGNRPTQYATVSGRLVQALKQNGAYLSRRHAADPERLLALDDESHLAEGTEQRRRRRWQQRRADRCRALMDATVKNLFVADMARLDATVRCRRCGNTSGIHQRGMQTRSMDEGQTVFCWCTHCGQRWCVRS